jgi:hypothetical protein
MNKEGKTFTYERALKRVRWVGEEKIQNFNLPLSKNERFFIKEPFIVRRHTDNINKVIYKAGYSGIAEDQIAWNPAHVMSELYARLELNVTSIKEQRLSETTEAQAVKTGVKPYTHKGDIELNLTGYDHTKPYKNGFINAWGMRYENTLYDWNKNPLVWVIDFCKVNPN